MNLGIDMQRIKIHFVAIIVKLLIDEGQVLMMLFGFVRSAEKNTKQTNIQKQAGVKAVEIEEIRVIGRADVYNMEVKGTHNFAVNGGVIVHNCMDSTRYFVQTMGIGIKNKKKAANW